MAIEDLSEYKIVFLDENENNFDVENLKLVLLKSIEEEKRELASKYNGVHYKKPYFLGEVVILSKRYSFSSSQHPKIVLRKIEDFKKKYYRNSMGEVYSQLLPEEILKPCKSLDGLIISNKGKLIEDRFPVYRILDPYINRGGYKIVTRKGGVNLISCTYQF